MSAETILNLVNEAKEDTIIPMPLQRPLSPPKPFPIDALGEILGPAVTKIAEIIQAPLGICGQSILAAVA